MGGGGCCGGRRGGDFEVGRRPVGVEFVEGSARGGGGEGGADIDGLERILSKL